MAFTCEVRISSSSCRLAPRSDVHKPRSTGVAAGHRFNGLDSAMNPRLLCLGSFVIGASLTVAACGGSTTPPASAGGSATTTTTAAGGSGQRHEFRECLRNQGVDLPAGFDNRRPGDRTLGSFPAGGPPGSRPAGAPAGADAEKFQAAMQKCGGSAGGPPGGFGGGPGGGSQAPAAYFSCLADHGVKVPTPPSGSTPGSIPRGPSALDALRSDPKFAAANETCRALLPTVSSTTTTTTTAS